MPRSATTGVFTRVSNSFSQPVFGTLIDPTDADAYFDDLDIGLNPPELDGPVRFIDSLQVGTTGTAAGTIDFLNATSGSITLTPPIGALGTRTLTLPAATDTLVGKDTTDVLNNKSMNSPVINGGLVSALTGFSLRDTSAAFNVTFVATSSPALSANRTLTINMNNASSVLVNTPAAGTTGQVVTGVTGSLPTFQTAGFRLLNVLTASNSATLVDTTSLTATYDTYMIVFENIVPVTNATQIFLRVSQNAGSSYLATGYLDASTATTEIRVTGSTSVDNTSGAGLSGHLTVSGVNQTDRKKQFTGTYAARVGGAAAAGFICGWYNTDNGAINALQFLAASGNLSTGIIRIYGMRSS
jgi:hypothetical protein